MEPVASSSVPDLRPRKQLGLIVLIAAGVAALAAVVIVLLVSGVPPSADAPGRAACERIEELAKQKAEYWDKFVAALVRTVEHRAWSSVDPKRVQISEGTRFERCTESFEVIRDLTSYREYSQIARCVSEARSWRTGAACFRKL